MVRRVTNPLIGKDERGSTILLVDELGMGVPTSPVDEVDNARVPVLLADAVEKKLTDFVVVKDEVKVSDCVIGEVERDIPDLLNGKVAFEVPACFVCEVSVLLVTNVGMTDPNTLEVDVGSDVRG